MAAEVTAEYNKELNPGPAQLLYDDITDHGRNDVVVQDAVAHAIKNVIIESPQSTTKPPESSAQPFCFAPFEENYCSDAHNPNEKHAEKNN